MTIHLPIPIEETLKNVLKDDEVIKTSYLQIGVRTGLRNKKVVFQDVVDISKVYDALKCLKYDYKNYLYAKIDLPPTLEEFITKIAEQPIQVFEMETESEVNISVTTHESNEPIITEPVDPDNRQTAPMLTLIDKEEL